ncbi:beta-microseminoprotein [Crotalus adamanteus]|uniref:Beta-microseminoprotein n=1 Tax=Crotalus adamanteus TaxID=8729 RepID=A0AAW1BJL7_CROAD
MVRHILVFLLILVLLRNLCDAQCSVKPASGKGCFQNGKWYRVPAVWKTNNCQRCECKPKELICCSLVFRPINYDKKKCIAMFHRQSCSIRVVKKNDPTESCKDLDLAHSGGVGKEVLSLELNSFLEKRSC